MSNLGWYQTITTLSKKVGGPRNLLVIVFGGGAIAGIGVENFIKKTAKIIRSKIAKKSTADSIQDKEYDVIADGKDSGGLALSVGDRYRVLEIDGDAILIEKLGDTNNPYFVSQKFLSSVSSFNTDSSSTENAEK